MNLYSVSSYLYFGCISKIQNEIVYGGYLAAVGAPSLVLTVSVVMNMEIEWPILLIAYLIPLTIYSFDYYKDLDKDTLTNSERSEYLKKKINIYPLILGLYVILLISLLLIYSSISLILFILFIFTGGILYSAILKKITKKIPTFKNVYTALTWALAGTLFIPLYYSLDLNFGYLIIFMFIFLKGMTNVIFFDLKDIESDEKEGLKTLPVILGKKKVIDLLLLLNIFTFIPLLVGASTHLISIYSLSLTIFLFYGFYYIYKAKYADNEDIRNRLCSLADAEFILWPLLLIITKTLF